MKQSIGYTYSCKNCKGVLGTNYSFFQNLNPINFGYLIDTCPMCGEKYVVQENDEFFTIKENSFFVKLFHSMIIWTIIISIFILIANIGYYFIYISFFLLYTLIFTLRWNIALKESKERLNNEKYIIDLLDSGILNAEDIKNFYNTGIISDDTYNKLICEVKQIINSRRTIY